MGKAMMYYPVFHCQALKLVGFLKSPYPEIFDRSRIILNFPVEDVVVESYQRANPNLWCM